MKYKVFLSKSYEIVSAVANGFQCGKNGVVRVAHGGCDETVPPLYSEQGYYMCCVSYGEDAKVKPYELIIG